MKTLRSNISEAYKVQADYFKDSFERVCSCDKNDMKEKVDDFVRLHKAIQEKLKAVWYSKQIEILTLVPDNSSECTVQKILMSLNTLIKLQMKSKK